jgi:gluconokinase
VSGDDDRAADARPDPLVVVMGVAGAGKSTVGPLVAGRLGVPFVDGDDSHDPADVARMRAGRPLDDARRGPWLARLHVLLADHVGTGLVLACSALRAAYRDVLRGELAPVVFVALLVDRDELTRRLGSRIGHFAGAALLDSQLATLEVGDDVVAVDATTPPDVTATNVVHRVRAAGRDRHGDSSW